MLDTSVKAHLEKQYGTLRTVHAGLLLSTLAYLGAGFWLFGASPRSTPRSPIWGFYLVGVALLFAASLVRRSVIPGSDAFQHAGSAVNALIAKVRNGYLACFVLCETISLLGLVAFILGGTLGQFISLSLLGISLLISSYPRKVE